MEQIEKPKNVDEYISTFPEQTQKELQLVRNTIKAIVAEAEETIGYAIPTYKLNGNLVHFAGYKNHVGFYPGSKALEVFSENIKGYKSAKGSVQFPLGKPMPLELIEKITKFRVQENLTNKKSK